MPASIKIKKADLEKFDLVRRLILADLTMHYTIPYLSAQSGLNELKLKVGFKFLYGSSIYLFLQDQRMQRACHLLVTTEDSIKSIAEQCGYGYATNFIAVFRKKFNIKPTHYRRIYPGNTIRRTNTMQPCYTDATAIISPLHPRPMYNIMG
jgi:AraC family transcriptional activator of pyochelin receptor